MKAKYYLAVVVLCAVPMFGQTGNQLIKQCGEAITNGDGPKQYSVGYCMGLVNGVAHMQGTIGCSMSLIPATVTLEQEIRVVLKYLADHPERLEMPDWALVAAALSDAWPESKKGDKQ